MNKFIVRAAAVMAAAAISFSAVSCGSKKDEHEHDHNMVGIDTPDENMGLDDLGYGATQKDDTPENSDVPIGVTYDPRYMTQDEAAKVVDYFYSLSSRDTSRLENALYPPVLELDLGRVDMESSQEFLDEMYDMYKETTGVEFEFTYVLVDDIIEDKEENSSEFAEYDDILKKADPDANVTEKKIFMVNCVYKEKGGTGSKLLRKTSSGEHYLYAAVYTIDAEPYVIA